MKTLELIKELKIDFTQSIILFDAGSTLEFEFDISPKDFLNFSKKDFISNDERGYVNALSNAKRAIDCQTDKILKSLGISLEEDKIPAAFNEFVFKYKNANKNNMPNKLIFLEAIGFAPTRLIAESRTLRNKIEHYYKKASKVEVENAIELAHLFILATNSKLGSVWDFLITDKQNYSKNIDGNVDFKKAIRIDYDTSKYVFRIGIFSDENRNSKDLLIKNSDIEFYYLLKIATSSDYSEDVHNALADLLERISHPIPKKNIKLEIDYC